jgi:hypothetical protein
VWGNGDDLRDPFARAIPAGTPYAIASGEDELMEKLSYLSPAEATIAALQAAYQRVAAEVHEEERGEAVSAEVSEGTIGAGRYGTLGHGSGSGSGVGYGGGAAGMGGHSARAPSVTVGAAFVAAGLAGIVREKFPPTLLFVARLPVDASGRTPLEVKLPDAVTTYLVEAIVWSADGWTWSTSTKLRVDKEILVDAPVPRYATVGDSLLVPVRAQNRSGKDLAAQAVVSVDQGATPLAGKEPIVKDLRVPAGEAAELSVPVTLGVAGDGKILVGLQANGQPLDAVRRPITVLAPARRERRLVETLAGGTGTLTIEVPAAATPRDGARIYVRSGLALFQPEGDLDAAWREAWVGNAHATEESVAPMREDETMAVARALGSGWANADIVADFPRDALRTLARHLGTLKPDDLAPRARVLLYLAPAARRLQARAELAQDLEGLLRQLRKQVTDGVARAKDDPALLAMTAAALAMTAPAGTDASLPRELVRRVRRHELRVGDDAWIAAQNGDRFTATALLALAEVALGERERAFERVRTLARVHANDGLPEATRTWARLAGALLTDGAQPHEVTVDIDGHEQKLTLKDGDGQLPAPELATPGTHRVRVSVGGDGAAVHVTAVTEYGMPWDATPARPGSVRATIEGQTKGRDERAGLELVVQNRAPRTIGRPILEVSLPAGAELDEDARHALRALTVVEPEATRGTLTLVLRAMPPGTSRRLPLALRWSVAGRLNGLGVVAYPDDQPEDRSITQPRAWEVNP